MSASKTVKAIGLPNLKYVTDKANVKRSTFNGWYHSNRQLFDVVVAGVKAVEEKKFLNMLRDQSSCVYVELGGKR